MSTDRDKVRDEVKVIDHPEVALIGVTTWLGLPTKYGSWLQGRAEQDMNRDGETVVEFAGRLCYLSFGPGKIDGHGSVSGRTNNAEYLTNIKRVGHGSVIEHANFTFLIEGVSRSLSHELVRHRHLSFSQLSQRYVDESEVAFVIPPEIQLLADNDMYEEWLTGCWHSLQQYKAIRREFIDIVGDTTTTTKKRANGTARSVLPNCTETKLVVTGNARAWRHFLYLRAALPADAEIRRLAFVIYELLLAECPNLFDDFQLVDSGSVVHLASVHGTF